MLKGWMLSLAYMVGGEVCEESDLEFHSVDSVKVKGLRGDFKCKITNAAL